MVAKRGRDVLGFIAITPPNPHGYSVDKYFARRDLPFEFMMNSLRLAEGFVQVKPLGPVPVKGVAEPVELFELVGAASVRTRLQASRARGFRRSLW